MLLKDMLKKGMDELKKNGIDEYENDARLIAMFVLGLDFTGLFVELNRPVNAQKVNEYETLIKKRAGHYPCQYIIGTKGFMGYTFNVAENVLIPRSETELLVEKALAKTEKKNSVNALDMCCGTGCIGISYILERRKNGHLDDKLTLADVSCHAVELSQSNSFLHSVECDIILSSLFEYAEKEADESYLHSYDIIMSNPPYIKSEEIDSLMEEVREYEPRLALDGSSDGLYFYRKITEEARKYLSEDGCILYEIGYDQYDAVYGILVDNGYRDIELTKDLAGLDRIVFARL